MWTNSISSIKQNLELFNHYARDLQDIEKADISRDMVGMIMAEKGVKANISALKNANYMSLSVIDILA